MRSRLIEALLSKGLSVHAAHHEGACAMDAICMAGECSLQDFTMFLEHADRERINERLRSGLTPLQQLCLEKDGLGLRIRDLEGKISALIEFGADPNLRTRKGDPLAVACLNEGNTVAARQLLKNGASWTDSHDNGINVALAAVLKGNKPFLEWMLSSKTDFPWDASCTIEHRIRSTVRNQITHSISGCSGLHLAALHGTLPIVRFFVEKKLLEVDCLCHNRRLTPLHFAALEGVRSVSTIYSPRVPISWLAMSMARRPCSTLSGVENQAGVRKLLELGAVPEHQDFHYNTPLSEAIKDGHHEVKHILAAAVREWQQSSS